MLRGGGETDLRGRYGGLDNEWVNCMDIEKGVGRQGSTDTMAMIPGDVEEEGPTG